MVHHHRYSQWRKVEAHEEGDEESHAFTVMDYGFCMRTKPKLISLLILSLLSCAFIIAPSIFGSESAFSILYSPGDESEGLSSNTDSPKSPPCSSVSDGTICCDRSNIRTDVCTMKGDVRTQSASSSIFLYGSRNRNRLTDLVSSVVDRDDETEGPQGVELQREKVKPYTRKWETSVMGTIDELDLVARKPSAKRDHLCEVYHNVPAVFFSTGGYTGNVYHEFNDGILPLYITSQRYRKRVVFVILEYHDWWITKYGDVLKRLSNYSPIDFRADSRTHCFPEAVVGLRIHGELSVDPSSMDGGNKTVVDFRKVLDRAYRPRIKSLAEDEEREARESSPIAKPKLLVVSRKGSSRSIANEGSMVKAAEEIGFRVEILVPEKTTEMAKIYRAVNSSDVVVGVHGAAMTHFLFMRPGSVFIQVIPLGTAWAAETYYGEPAKKLGLNYIGYEIAAQESSLYDKYDHNDPVLRDPESVNKKGWEFTKNIYLGDQDVRLNLTRFKTHLVHAYDYSLNTRTHVHAD